MGLLHSDEEESVLQMLADRHLTSHNDDETRARKFFERIRDQHAPLLLRGLHEIQSGKKFFEHCSFDKVMDRL